MLAQTYNGKLPSFAVLVQPKLDGVRGIANAQGLWSRRGLRITACRHIEEAFGPFFAANPAAVLDGELYNHGLRDGLNAIISLVNTRQPNEAVRMQSEALIQFHVFDTPSHSGAFSERLAFLNTALRPLAAPTGPIRFVETTPLSSMTELDDLFASYLDRGYEGQMIRLDAPYEPTRSMRLLKRKPFHDAEFEVVRIDEVRGTGSGFAKRAILRLPDGRSFGAGIKGSRDFATALLGRRIHSATVRFASLTPSGIPRSPIATAFYEKPPF